nr:MAG TPA: hypothetical protein [Crassvirales sp.]
MSLMEIILPRWGGICKYIYIFFRISKNIRKRYKYKPFYRFIKLLSFKIGCHTRC